MFLGDVSVGMMGGLNPKTIAYLNAMTSQPSGTQITKINDFINALEQNNLWDKFDMIYHLEAHADQPSRLNMVNPGYGTLTVQGATSFTANSGWISPAGSNSDKLSSGVNLNALAKYQPYDAHMSVWCNTNLDENANEIGAGASGADNSYIRANYNYYYIVGAINMGSTNFAHGDNRPAGGTKTAIGHTLVQRVSSSAHEIYKDGLSCLVDYINGNTYEAPANYPLMILGGNAANGGSKRMGFASVGSKFTAGEALIYYNALNTLMA